MFEPDQAWKSIIILAWIVCAIVVVVALSIGIAAGLAFAMGAIT